MSRFQPRRNFPLRPCQFLDGSLYRYFVRCNGSYISYSSTHCLCFFFVREIAISEKESERVFHSQMHKRGSCLLKMRIKRWQTVKLVQNMIRRSILKERMMVQHGIQLLNKKKTFTAQVIFVSDVISLLSAAFGSHEKHLRDF